MDYVFNDRDLRVQTDVSDLKLDPLFWRRVLGKNLILHDSQLLRDLSVTQADGRETDASIQLWPNAVSTASGMATSHGIKGCGPILASLTILD